MGNCCTLTKFASFVDRAKDTLKVSGAQVSPTEIEDVIRTHPDKLITDVSVAGVSGGRTSDEKIPRAWLVLSEAGRRLGAEKTIRVLDAWVKQNLSKYKWVRGGYEITDQASDLWVSQLFWHSLNHDTFRYPNLRQARFYEEY